MSRTTWSFIQKSTNEKEGKEFHREVHQWVGPNGLSSRNPLMRRTARSLIEKSANEKDCKEFDRKIHQWEGLKIIWSRNPPMRRSARSLLEIHQREGLKGIWWRNPPMRRNARSLFEKSTNGKYWKEFDGETHLWEGAWAHIPQDPGSGWSCFRTVWRTSQSSHYYCQTSPESSVTPVIKRTFAKGFISEASTRRSADGPMLDTFATVQRPKYSPVQQYITSSQRYSGICILHNGKNGIKTTLHTLRKKCNCKNVYYTFCFCILYIVQNENISQQFVFHGALIKKKNKFPHI